MFAFCLFVCLFIDRLKVNFVLLRMYLCNCIELYLICVVCVCATIAICSVGKWLLCVVVLITRVRV